MYEVWIKVPTGNYNAVDKVLIDELNHHAATRIANDLTQAGLVARVEETQAADSPDPLEDPGEDYTWKTDAASAVEDDDRDGQAQAYYDERHGAAANAGLI